MIQKIFVPLDGSGFGEESVPFAAMLARRAQVPLELLHVHVPDPPVHLLGVPAYQWEGADLDEYDREDEENEHRYLEYQANKASPHGEMEVHCTMLKGAVPEAIHAHAKASGEGLILMSTHGRTGLSRAWWGSVADAVMRNSPVPVLLIHTRNDRSEEDIAPTEIKRILIALDGSPNSERALAPAADLAKALGARVKLFHVAPPGFRVGARASEKSIETANRVVADARDYLERNAYGLREEGIDVTVEVVGSTQPADAIIDVILRDGIDLVALAPRGLDGLPRAMLGSVTDRVLQKAAVPMLVVGRH